MADHNYCYSSSITAHSTPNKKSPTMSSSLSPIAHKNINSPGTPHNRTRSPSTQHHHNTSPITPQHHHNTSSPITPQHHHNTSSPITPQHHHNMSPITPQHQGNTSLTTPHLSPQSNNNMALYRCITCLKPFKHTQSAKRCEKKHNQRYFQFKCTVKIYYYIFLGFCTIPSSVWKYR